ncbi:MAG: FeoB-associated Cys-rich membrane protein, partial [Thermoplasmata archaeon]|nr:FeoB-associated Cys-rich membrane protein [Thermoplasmata archaeon]
MNEYPRNEGDLNERNFKHTPVDTLDTMELYAGSNAELLKGINTGLTIGYQLILEVSNLTTPMSEVTLEPEESVNEEKMKEVCFSWWLIALVMVVVIFLAIYYFIPRLKKGKD